MTERSQAAKHSVAEITEAVIELDVKDRCRPQPAQRAKIFFFYRSVVEILVQNLDEIFR